MSDKTPEISSYAYCLNNPLKYVDPDGKLPDAIWDAVWIAWDGASFLYNTIVGNNQEAAMDAACFTADGATLFVPGMPAVSGPARAGAKLAPKVAETTPKLAKAIDKAKKTFQTYIKRNPKTGEVYVGRTSGTKSPLQNVKDRDSKHHKSAEGFGPAEMVNSSTSKDAIRGQEQRLIDQYGGAKSSGGTSGNAINGVSPQNPNAEKYRQAAQIEFGD